MPTEFLLEMDEYRLWLVDKLVRGILIEITWPSRLKSLNETQSGRTKLRLKGSAQYNWLDLTEAKHGCRPSTRVPQSIVHLSPADVRAEILGVGIFGEDRPERLAESKRNVSLTKKSFQHNRALLDPAFDDVEGQGSKWPANLPGEIEIVEGKAFKDHDERDLLSGIWEPWILACLSRQMGHTSRKSIVTQREDWRRSGSHSCLKFLSNGEGIRCMPGVERVVVWGCRWATRASRTDDPWVVHGEFSEGEIEGTIAKDSD
jgi:hypothetical protein